MALFTFVPSNKSAPNFLPTLDGTQYYCTVTWNLAAQRYYLNCYQVTGRALVFSIALIESPAAQAINGIVWNSNSTTATVTMVNPHGLKLGTTVQMVVAGCLPDTYNGTVLMLATGPNTLTYSLTTDPLSPSMVQGSAGTILSMTAGYFESTIVFRNNTFEVNP